MSPAAANVTAQPTLNDGDLLGELERTCVGGEYRLAERIGEGSFGKSLAI